MFRRVPALVLCLACCEWSGFLTAGAALYDSDIAQKKRQWDAFAYKMSAKPRRGEFNLGFKVSVRDPQAVVRVLVACRDHANYYCVELSRRGVRILKVEHWREREIGARSGVTLSDTRPQRVLIKRRRNRIVVIVGNEVVTQAYDDSFGAGNVGFGVRGGPVSIGQVREQRVGDIYFADDFMRGDEQAGAWEAVAGDWRLSSVENVSMSSNAFSYAGRAAEGQGTSIVGEWFWDNYSFSVGCQAADASAAIGVYFYYRDENNYHLFRWGKLTARGKYPHRMQLVKVLNGEQTVLAQRAAAFQTSQWHKLRADVRDGLIRTYVDDDLIFEKKDANLCCGKVGLYVEGCRDSTFDDVLVHGLPGFDDDFTSLASGRWRTLGGKWRRTGGACEVLCTSPVKAVAGDVRWRDYAVSLDVGYPGMGEVGACARYQDEDNYYLFACGPTSARLVSVANGKKRVLDEHKEFPLKEGRHHFRFQVESGYLAAYVDGAKVCEAADMSLLTGEVALYAADVSGATFHHARIEFPHERRPIFAGQGVFTAERSMHAWAAARNDWHDRWRQIQGRWTRMTWHRAHVPGDNEMEIRLHGMSRRSQVRLITAAEGHSAESGYCLAASPGSPDELNLYRNGRKAADGTIDDLRNLRHLKLIRRGGTLVALADHRPVLTFRDPKPLQGTRVAYAVSSVNVEPRDVRVRCDNVFVYTFQNAPTDWRVGAGTWGVTNRWACDPRWSFFSGRPQTMSGPSRLAAIWHKREFVGDVSLEFAAGIKMSPDRGRNYEYASDMNATICADGQDLASGYSFIFGGWNNQYTRILRRNDVVAESRSRVIPTRQSIHRRWFYIKIENRGGRLQYWIDNELALEYRDPRPLRGRRLAIWTWNNGIMVARVRLSCGHTGRLEPAGTSIAGTERCCYDQTARISTVESPQSGSTSEQIARFDDPQAQARISTFKVLAAKPSAVEAERETTTGEHKPQPPPSYPNRLRVSSQPDRASVFLDDQYVGVTPLTVQSIRPGLYLLKVTKHRFRAWVKPIRIANTNERASVVLRPQSLGAMLITSKPNGAQIYVNDKLAGTTPLNLRDLMPDTYRLRVQMPNYLPWHGQTQVRAEKTERVQVALKLRAEAFYLAGIQRDPTNASYHCELAHLYVLQHRYDDAGRHLAEALRLVSSYDSSQYSSRLYQEIRKIHQASFNYGHDSEVEKAREMLHRILETAIRMSASNLSLYTVLGQCYLSVSRARDAIRVLNVAVANFPTSYQGHYYLGRAYLAEAQEGVRQSRARAKHHLLKALSYCQNDATSKQIRQYLAQVQ